jgi:hypothetical protein
VGTHIFEFRLTVVGLLVVVWTQVVVVNQKLVWLFWLTKLLSQFFGRFFKTQFGEFEWPIGPNVTHGWMGLAYLIDFVC